MQHVAKKTERSLEKLCLLVGITPEYGWKKILANWIGIDRALLSTWLNRDSIPKKHISEIAERGYPPETWLVSEAVYPETPEHIGAPAHDPRPGSYGIPDLGRHSVTQLYSPVISNREYLAMVREILESEEVAVAEALRANVRQFHEQVKLTRRLQDLENQIRDLKSEVKKTRCPHPSHSPQGVAEGGGR